MTWTINLQRRTPGEREAYIQGFESAAKLAVKYQADGKSLDDLITLIDVLRTAHEEPDDQPPHLSAVPDPAEDNDATTT